MPQTSYSQSVAAEVRAEMARQQKAGVDLAKHLGMKQSTLSRRLTGEIAFNLDQIAAVAEWLEVEIERFVDVCTAKSAAA